MVAMRLAPFLAVAVAVMVLGHHQLMAQVAVAVLAVLYQEARQELMGIMGAIPVVVLMVAVAVALARLGKQGLKTQKPVMAVQV
ncbi:MAG: hypothetical protein OIF34_12510 [Porticoccaceae bacterium]|nr:hypothetical protein [Porticoccaceae bacterium]